MNTIICWILAGCLLSVTAIAATDPAAAQFAGPIEKAHQATRYYAQPALEAEIDVVFGGKPMLQAKMLMDTPAGRSRFELPNGSVAVFDGHTAWVSPADAELPMARFHVLTWPYFLAAPYKLRDPGTHLEPLGAQPARGTTSLAAAKLTFGKNIGDTPDDWYIVYRNAPTNRLHSLAYIVTYGKDTAAAEKEPHAIVYEKFVDVDGVPISTEWTFWHWSPETGIGAGPIGKVTLRNVHFVTPAAAAFTAPPGAREEKLPE